ncbi:MAG: 16S rRNA (guanine(527)-N(7))-methyltransferase RsmG [Pseudomonadota bacterium]
MGTAFDNAWKMLVIQSASDFGVDLSPSQADQMAYHASEMTRWNKKTNITAIVNPLEMAIKHYVDSLAIVRDLPLGARLLDIGSGGGFPGFPLKVARPDIRAVLIDASRKRISFIKSVIGSLQMTGIDAVHARAEDLACDPEYLSSFDIVTSRALSSLDAFSGMARPFLIPGKGIILAMKGKEDSREMEGLSAHGFTATIRHYLLVPGNHKRCIVAIKPAAP